jgi:hypothetical protein
LNQAPFAIPCLIFEEKEAMVAGMKEEARIAVIQKELYITESLMLVAYAVATLFNVCFLMYIMGEISVAVFVLAFIVYIPLAFILLPLVTFESLALYCLFSLFYQLYKLFRRHLKTIPEPLMQNEA